MLEPLPSRNVTRFLLPLADVMTLLFAIFLLMPILEQQPGVEAEEAPRPGALWTPGEQRQVREELGRLRRLSEVPASQRLQVVLLRIDPKNADLIARDADREIRLASQADVDQMVKKHLDAVRPEGKELLYVIQLPPPDQDFIFDIVHQENYRQWFGKWQVRYEVPWRPASTPSP